MDLNGKTAIVTGASSGHRRCDRAQAARGRACASPVGRGGWSGSRPTSRSRSTSPTRPARPRSSRRRSPSSAGSTSSSTTPGSRSAGRRSPSRRADDEERVIHTNVDGVMRMTRLVLPHIRDEGHILFMGSIAGRQAYPGGASYIASKFAVRGFSYALREDLLGRPIRITTVDAGLVETEFSLVRFKGDQEKADAVYEGLDPGHAGRGRRLRDVRAHAAAAREPRRDRDQGDRPVVGLARRAQARSSDAVLRLRSPYDRQILRFAIPALGALAAEPLYVLVDTAVVGHLGRSQLAALGLAATVLSVLAMFNFLQYGTTAQVARATGAGEDLTAARLGAQCLWLSLAFGCALALAVARARGARRRSLRGGGGDGGLRGHLSADRGARDPVGLPRDRRPGLPPRRLRPAHAAPDRDRRQRRQRDPRGGGSSTASISGSRARRGGRWSRRREWASRWSSRSCAASVVANAGLRPELARRLLSLGKFIFIRTVSLIASFILAGAVVTRLGDAPLAAHQIAFQLWIFLALVLDAIAIAGQIIVGQELGASRPDEAYAASVRMIWLSIVVGAVFAVVLLALSRGDPAGLHLGRRRARPVRAAVAALRADAAAQRHRLRDRRHPDRRERRALPGAVDGGRVRSSAPPCSPSSPGRAGACAASGPRSSCSSSRAWR